MDVRHSGQPLSIEATVSAQLSQNSRMAARHKGDASARGNQTSQQSVDCGDCAAVSVALVSLDGVVTSCRGSCCCGALSSSLISEFQLLFKFHHFHRNSEPVIFVSRHYPMDVLTKVWFIWPVIFQSYTFSSSCYLVRHFPVLHFPFLHFPHPLQDGSSPRHLLSAADSHLH